MDMGWVNPWVGLGPGYENWRFYSHVIGVLISNYTYLYWNSKLTQPSMWLFLYPFAEFCDGTSTFGTKNDTDLQFSGRSELATYNAMKVPAASGRPLNFWREQSGNYPVLSQVARRVLAISASSAQSERNFSSVGHTLKDLRTRLSANKVEADDLLRWGLRAGMQAHVYWRCNVTFDGYEWCMLPGFTVFLMVQYNVIILILVDIYTCLLYTSPSPRD